MMTLKIFPDACGDEQNKIPDLTSAPAGAHQREALIIWIRNFCARRLNLKLYDQRRGLAPHVVIAFGRVGLLGLLAPKALGGLELSHQDALRVEQQLAAIDLSLAAFVGIHNALGLHPLLKYGNEAQRASAGDFVRGHALLAFALSETGAGSDPRSITTTATLGNDKKWLLNGSKIWIGNAAWSDAILVIARALDSTGRDLGFTAFVVPTDRTGVMIGREALTMGLRGLVQNELAFTNVNLNDGEILGDVGQGLEVANSAMQMGRLGIGAMGVGVMKRCLLTMYTYAENRNVGDRKLTARGFVVEQLMNVAQDAALTEGAVRKAAWLLDEGKVVPEPFSLSIKIVAAECAWDAADGLMQTVGGRGYEEANGIPRLFRDVRILRIFEGPTESLQAYLGTTALFAFRTMRREIETALGAGGATAAALQDIADWCAETRKFATTWVPAQGMRSFMEAVAIPMGDLVAWRLTILMAVDPETMMVSTIETQRHASQRLRSVHRRWQESLKWESDDSGLRTVQSLAAQFEHDVGGLIMDVGGEVTGVDPILLAKCVSSC